jgi:zinc transport system permease protein
MAEGPTLSLFLESWDLFRDAALAGALAGGLLGFLGVYVVLRRMVFVSAALSQSAGLGVTLAFYAKLHLGFAALASPTAFASATTLLAALLLMTDRSSGGAQRESMLGFAYVIGGAGALAIGTRIVEEVHDVHTILFGSAVAVLREDFLLVLGMTLLFGAVHIWWMRGFVQASFDRDGALVRGLPVRLLEAILLVTLALAISVATRVLGALPVFAFSVLPAMAALRLCANVPRALYTAAALGALSGLLGYVFAFINEIPVGAAQTLVAALLVVAAELWRFVGRHLTSD